MDYYIESNLLTELILKRVTTLTALNHLNLGKFPYYLRVQPTV